MHIAVPAYRNPGQQPYCPWGPGSDCWSALRNSLTNFPGAGKANIVVVGDDTWHQNPNPDAMNTVYEMLQTGCTVLGYIEIRDSSLNVLSSSAVQTAVSLWMTNYSGLTGSSGGPPLSIDGVYFDSALLPGYSSTEAKARVKDFRAAYPNAKIMVLAGFTTDQWVVGNVSDPTQPAPDWALMFEGDLGTYEGMYAASTDPANTLNQAIPSWWKDPANADRFAHTVVATGQGDAWQRVLSLAVERNVNHLFMLDIDPNQAIPGTSPTQYFGYRQLPTYWETATQWMQSYETGYIGLNTELMLRAAQLWARRHVPAYVHAWPNGEQAWYGNTQERGTYNVTSTGARDIKVRTVALQGNPPLYNVAAVCRAAHEWAITHQYKTAWPTFVDVGAGQYQVAAVMSTARWVTIRDIPTSAVYEQPPPTFAEPYALMRNLHRAARQLGFETARPTFRADNAQGTMFNNQSVYEVAVITNSPREPEVHLQDVEGELYGREVGV